MAAHERLVERYLEDHPDADWSEAYEATVDGAYDESREMMADMIDGAKMRAKDEGNWPPRKKSP